MELVRLRCTARTLTSALFAVRRLYVTQFRDEVIGVAAIKRLGKFHRAAVTKKSVALDEQPSMARINAEHARMFAHEGHSS